MTYPKVSIQIPTYNQGKFIQKTVESCLMQNYPNLEINIADDNSTDDTIKLIQPFLSDQRIRFYRNDRNIGRVANYRKALNEYATGDWALNLDGDDYFTLPDFITRAISLVTSCSEKNIFVVQGNHDAIKTDKLYSAQKIAGDAYCINGKTYFTNYFKMTRFNHCATLYNRYEAMRLGFYTYDSLFTDFNSVSKLFLRGDIIIMTDQVAHWRVHGKNESMVMNNTQLENEIRSIDDIVKYASTVISPSILQLWSKKMKEYMFTIYVDMRSTRVEKLIAAKYLLKNFEPSFVYAKQILRCLKGIFHK